MISLTFDVFGKPQLRVVPQAVVIEENEGMHDVATVVLEDADVRKVTAAVGLPCRLSCQENLRSKIFYGYFDTTAPSMNADTSTGTYFLLGSTAVMRNGTPRVWHNKRPQEIARELTKPYGLGLEFEKYEFTVPFFSQSTESDWQTLVRLAGATGLSITSTGVTVRFADVLQETRRSMRMAAPVTYKVPGLRTVEPGIAADSFIIVDSKTPLGGEKFNFFGIDKFGVNFKVTGGVSDISKHQPVAVSCLADARREARRADAMSRYLTRGVLSAAGVLEVKPGMCVAVDDVGGVREMWYVSGVKHRFTVADNRYTATLDLCRHDGSGVGYGVPGISSNVRPTPSLIGSKWRGDKDWSVEL